MQTIDTADRGVDPSVSLSVCSSVCLSRGVARLYYTNTAERIKMLFGVNALGGPGNIFRRRSWSLRSIGTDIDIGLIHDLAVFAEVVRWCSCLYANDLSCASRAAILHATR